MSVFKYPSYVYIPKLSEARGLIVPDVDTRTKKGRAEADRLLRIEYSRLRAVAVKRLERLSRSEFKEDQPYQRYHNRFRKLSEMKRPGDVSRALADVYAFLSMKSSTIKGATEVRSNILQGLQEHGVSFVKSENLRDFGEFMELLRSKLLDRIYDSERAYKVYTQARKLGMKWHGDLEKEFDFFYHNSESMKKLRKMSDAKKKAKLNKETPTLASYYRKQLEKWRAGKGGSK